MKRDFMNCVGIFDVSMTGVLGIHKTTMMTPSSTTIEKKCWIDNSVMDRQ
jgi:hypothetical protein